MAIQFIDCANGALDGPSLTNVFLAGREWPTLCRLNIKILECFQSMYCTAKVLSGFKCDTVVEAASVVGCRRLARAFKPCP